MIRVALDTNILAYLAGVCRSESDAAKISQIRDLIRGIVSAATLVAPTQTLGELFVVMRRCGASSEEARAILVEFAESFATPVSELRTVMGAADLVVDHELQLWDALIITASADAGCSLFLSEDMQNGFVVRGMTIIKPLTTPPHPKLAALLSMNAPPP
jgi:predicted nucleic acid-binding protein